MDEKRLKDESISKIENNRKDRKGRPAGYPKTGGRQSGTPNRKTLSFAKELDGFGFNIAEKIVACYESTNDLQMKIKLIELAAKYRLSMPTKDVEESDVQQTAADVMKLVADEQ